MENQDIEFIFSSNAVLNQSQQDSLNIKLKHIILLEEELGFVVPVLYTKPEGGTLFNLKQYVDDVNSRKGISKPEDYSAIGMFLDNNIIHLESMKNQKESQEVKESPKKEETMNNQDNNKLAFTFSTEKLPEGYTLDKLNNKLNTIIDLEESLDFKELKIYFKQPGDSCYLKSYVKYRNDIRINSRLYTLFEGTLDNTINRLNQMVKESKQEVQEQPVECPEKEEIKFTFKDDKLPSDCKTSTLNELLKEIIHIEETVLGWDDLKLFTDVSGNTPIDLKSYVELNDYVLGEHHCRAIHRRLTRTLNKLKELGDESLKEQVVPEKEETSLKPWEQEELEHTSRVTNDFKQLFKSSPIAFKAVESAMNVIVLADETHKKYGLGHLQITIDGEEMNIDKYLESREPGKGWLPAKYTFLSREILAESKLFKDLADKIISDFEAEIKANSDWCK